MSESVWMFVPYLLRNGEPQQAEILRDDSPLDAECFRLKNIRIRQTVCRKIACKVFMYCILATLALNFILSSMNPQRI